MAIGMLVLRIKYLILMVVVPQDCRADKIPNATAPLHVPKNPVAYAGFYSDNFKKDNKKRGNSTKPGFPTAVAI